jgi:predicted transcriptional regulator
MNQNFAEYAKYFLEVSSEQRLDIIQLINEKNLRLSEISKLLNATTPEVHRNLERLEKSGFIIKNSESHYVLTTLGQMLLSLIPNFAFVIENKRYFIEHPIDSLPQKFILRLGELFEGKFVSSYVSVLDSWRNIYENAQEYIHNILYEVPYFDEFVKPITNKLENGVKIKSIFYEKAMVSNSRPEVVKKLKKYIESEAIQRMMIKKVAPAVTINEKQSCLIFPSREGKVDAGYAFVSEDPLFHQWCFDYFNYSWYNAEPFAEMRLGAKT